MRDIERMSEKEMRFYRNTKLVKRQVVIILSGTVVVVLVSILFLSLKFIFPDKNNFLFNEFFNLGLDCWAFVLGLLCLLKSALDKHNYVTNS